MKKFKVPTNFSDNSPENLPSLRKIPFSNTERKILPRKLIQIHTYQHQFILFLFLIFIFIFFFVEWNSFPFPPNNSSSTSLNQHQDAQYYFSNRAKISDRYLWKKLKTTFLLKLLVSSGWATRGNFNCNKFIEWMEWMDEWWERRRGTGDLYKISLEQQRKLKVMQRYTP